MKKVLTLTGLSLATLFFVACSDEVKNSKQAGNYKNHICLVENLNDAQYICEDGDVMLYRPTRWGNEQLPVVASAFSCNFNFPIVTSNGGVSCVFQNRNIKIAKSSENIENNQSK